MKHFEPCTVVLIVRREIKMLLFCEISGLEPWSSQVSQVRPLKSDALKKEKVERTFRLNFKTNNSIQKNE